VDLIEALLSDIYNLVTGDAAMQTLMGGSVVERGEWLHQELDKVDPELPYLVHSFEEETVGTDCGFANGFYTVDAYVYCEKRADKEKLYRIRGRLVELLDERYLTNPIYSYCFLWLEGRGRRLPTDSTEVKRYSLPFRARYARTQEIKAILAR